MIADQDTKQDTKYYNHISDVGSSWLSDFAYHGHIYNDFGPTIMDKSICDQIKKFMDYYGIGKSEYGALMDAAGKKEFVHRLYAHHLIYDFPYRNPDKVLDFLIHEFSDLFTKNGLPIIPGEFLENAPKWLSKITKNPCPCKNWNFINGFDLLAGTIVIFSASRDIKLALMEELCIESLGDIAKTFGVGIVEFAIAISTANPLLLLGSLLELTAGARAIFNNVDVIYMQNKLNSLTLEFSLKQSNLDDYIRMNSLEFAVEQNSLENYITNISRYSFE